MESLQERQHEEKLLASSAEDMGKQEGLEENQLGEEGKSEDQPLAVDSKATTEELDPKSGESKLVEELSSLIKKRIPEKSRYITNKILHECKDRIQEIVDSPELLELEISKGIEASKKKRTSRRRRGKRGGKRAKRAAMNATTEKDDDEAS